MKYNAVLDTKFSEEASTEPITVAEAKEWLILSADITEDDVLIGKIIKASRIRLERATNVSFIARTVKALMLNQLGGILLPYGPVNSFTSLLDDVGGTIATDDYKLIGDSFKQIKTAFCENITATYTSGFDSLPDDMREDLLNQVAYAYENRGDQAKASKLSPLLSLSYSRKDL